MAVLVVHEIDVCIVEGAMPRWLGQPKTYHGYDSRHGLREWSTTSTGRITDGGLDSRKGGTGVPFLGCAGKGGVWSHLGGTDKGLLCGRKLI